MTSSKFLTFGTTPALSTAVQLLKGWGYSFTDTPDSTVTHLLLPVPTFAPNGTVHGGGQLETVLQALPHSICVIGGNLTSPLLQNRNCIDLLQDAIYLSENAYITAHCALRLALSRLPVALRGCKVLIIGWGRIGKCLAALLKALGAEVAVAVRNDAQRAILRAMGYEAEVLPLPDYILPRFRAVFNTVPAPVLSKEALRHCRPGCLKIELASSPGMEGSDIIDARGLPGKMAPESSGKLIARTVLQLCARKEAGK